MGPLSPGLDRQCAEPACTCARALTWLLRLFSLSGEDTSSALPGERSPGRTGVRGRATASLTTPLTALSDTARHNIDDTTSPALMLVCAC